MNNKLIKDISEDIIYSENLPLCLNGLCDVYAIHDFNTENYCFNILYKYVSDWKKQFKGFGNYYPAYVYNIGESCISWNESRYNLVLLLFLSNGGEL